jgi:hypothetical protein
MAASDHLAHGQFHRRPGRPNKSVHSSSDEEESSAPKKPHVHVHKSHPLPKHRGH